LAYCLEQIAAISNEGCDLALPPRESLRGPKFEGGNMFCFSLGLLPRWVIKLSLALLAVIGLLAAPAAVSYAQKTGADQPLFSDFKGVRIGMSTDEARKKLGSPRDKGDDQDFYVFNDTQAVQVFYDKTKTVTAISIDYMSGANAIPAAKDVVGSEPETKADGSAYKMVRYPKSGFWVSYSKTAGTSPTITVTLQKIDH
jgi:hypothetical protein